MNTENAVADKSVEPPLCVDLDGTLIKSDLLYESTFSLLKKNIFYIFLLPIWLLQGKARLKHEIASRAEVNVKLLPYSNEFLQYLKNERLRGRKLVLATASNTHYAEQVNSHLEIFDRIVASDLQTNMSGKNKRDSLISSFGSRGFDYAGNAKVDFSLWSECRNAIVVNPERGVADIAKRKFNVTEEFKNKETGIKQYVKAIRVHQWVKNSLIFIPLLMSHQLHDTQLIINSILAFITFSLSASSVYLLNDLLDLDSDRQHPRKCKRPLASGNMPLLHGILLIPVLLAISLGLSILLPLDFLLALTVYYAVTIAYSFRLKRVLIVDALTLAGLYTMRIISGAAAIETEPSFWLLSFSMFIFYSLALVKRYSELLSSQRTNKAKIAGRGYRAIDIEGLSQSGTASGFLSILVLALYINGDDTSSLYTHPQALWLLCPLILYWINRVWLLTRRDEMHDDPIVFAIFDRKSHFVAILAIAILIVAI